MQARVTELGSKRERDCTVEGDLHIRQVDWHTGLTMCAAILKSTSTSAHLLLPELYAVNVGAMGRDGFRLQGVYDRRGDGVGMSAMSWWIVPLNKESTA